MKRYSNLFSPSRVSAIVLRYLYLLRGSWPRKLELIYWPTMQMTLWGFLNQFLATNSHWVAQASGVLISAVLLWDVLYRSQLGVSVVFLEEMYSRNLGNLFVTPLRPYELISALLTISLIRTFIGVGCAALLAIPFYGYSIFNLGLPLLAFLINLVLMGWSIGLVVASLVLRYGLGAESLAWALIFAVQPISGIYYPITVLPEWLQHIAFLLPSSHVFEGLRALLFEHQFRMDLMRNALLINAFYLTFGVALFLRTVYIARQRGLLLRMGE